MTALENVPTKLILRIAVLSLVAVLVQETVISKISIFGVDADITPLVVMSVGLLCGSLTGAITGFFIGLMVDTVLGQTLGVTSLLYITIGYWTGRLRELRDPAHGLIPVACGAAATAVTGIGMTVIQFLLGVDAPVSLLLAQQIFLTILVNTLISLPVYAVVRRNAVDVTVDRRVLHLDSAVRSRCGRFGIAGLIAGGSESVCNSVR